MWFALFIDVARASCGAPYTVDAMVADLSEIEQGLRDGADDRAGPPAKRLAEGLPCLDSPLNPTLSARIFRSLGAGLVAAGEVERGTAWMRTSVEVDSAFTFGVDEMADGHAAWDAWSAAQGMVPEPVALEGKELVDGTWKLDGRSLTAPAATVDRPHLLQRSFEGTWTSWGIEGNAFPGDTLRELKPEKAPRDPKARSRKCRKGIRFKGFVDSEGVYCAATPGEQIFFTLSGPIVVGSAGLLYLEGFRQYGLARDASTIDELRMHKRINNRVVAGSAALAGVGVGLAAFGLTYTGSF
ncbi:MAG: hypothetical protein R3F61_00525 [Myxococcota bacterium]